MAKRKRITPPSAEGATETKATFYPVLSVREQADLLLSESAKEHGVNPGAMKKSSEVFLKIRLHALAKIDRRMTGASVQEKSYLHRVKQEIAAR